MVLKNSSSRKQTGNIGEKIATDYLKKRGYKILERNFIFRIPGNPQKSEIDIIAKLKDLISFVEVKTIKPKKSSSAIPPEAKVNLSKRRKLQQAAEAWLIENKIPLNSKWQIDILTIRIEKGKKEISHFKNAVCGF